MRSPNRARLAFGFSLVLHSGLAATLYLLAPAVSTHAGVSVGGINTRTGSPRTAHLSLWDEPPSRSAASPFAKPAAETVLAPVIAPTLNAPGVASKSTFLSPTTSTHASDIAALTNRRAEDNSTGTNRVLPLDAGNLPGGSGGSGGSIHDARSTLRASGLLRVGKQVQSIVFVIDGSQSMGLDGLFESAQRELVASIDALPETTRFQVIVYNRSAGPLRINGFTDLVPATDSNKQAAAELIRKVEPQGSTDHVRALQQAMILRPEMILFVTDADGLHGEQVHALTVLNHGRAAINTIELNGGRRKAQQSPLQILAEQNHGDFRTARAIEK